MRAQPLFVKLAATVQARLNCIAKSPDHEWIAKHEDTIADLINDFLPHGSGVDSGCSIDLDKSTGDKLIITTSFHHMNDGGYYDGWTEHTITVVPSLQSGFTMRISGRDRNEIKDYLYDLFQTALSDLIDYDDEKKHYFSIAMREAAAEYQKRLAAGDIR